MRAYLGCTDPNPAAPCRGFVGDCRHGPAWSHLILPDSIWSHLVPPDPTWSHLYHLAQHWPLRVGHLQRPPFKAMPLHPL